MQALHSLWGMGLRCASFCHASPVGASKIVVELLRFSHCSSKPSVILSGERIITLWRLPARFQWPPTRPGALQDAESVQKEIGKAVSCCWKKKADISLSQSHLSRSWICIIMHQCCRSAYLGRGKITIKLSWSLNHLKGSQPVNVESLIVNWTDRGSVRF